MGMIWLALLGAADSRYAAMLCCINSTDTLPCPKLLSITAVTGARPHKPSSLSLADKMRYCENAYDATSTVNPLSKPKKSKKSHAQPNRDLSQKCMTQKAGATSIATNPGFTGKPCARGTIHWQHQLSTPSAQVCKIPAATSKQHLGSPHNTQQLSFYHSGLVRV